VNKIFERLERLTVRYIERKEWQTEKSEKSKRSEWKTENRAERLTDWHWQQQSDKLKTPERPERLKDTKDEKALKTLKYWKTKRQVNWQTDGQAERQNIVVVECL